MTRSDEELLRGFAGGERSALGALAERYEPRLLSLAGAILGSRELAVDAVQETWLRVVRYAGSYAGRSSVKTWLYRIAINQCRSLLRARPEDTDEEMAGDGGPSDGGLDACGQTGDEGDRVAEVRNASARTGQNPIHAGNEPADGRSDPAAVAAARDEAERLKRAVEQLSPPLREAVVVCYTQGLTHEEAAVALGVPVGTVKSRIHAALARLRGRLQASGPA